MKKIGEFIFDNLDYIILILYGIFCGFALYGLLTGRIR